jgi:citrate lyase beta subunit
MHDLLRLGASLYVPATRPDIIDIATGSRLCNLRSVIFCTEDAVAANQVDYALENLSEALDQLQPSSTLRFVRVRNPTVMMRLLKMRGIDRLDGFVLPKVTRRNFASYASLVSADDHYWLMPTLETSEVFDTREMQRFRRLMDGSPIRDRILALRIGGNDLLNVLGLRRAVGATIYDTPLATVISNLINVFRPAEYQLTAPVFDRLDALETLSREVAQDVAFGLISKSAVHPLQIDTIEHEYGVTYQEAALAEAVLAPEAKPIFQLHGWMCEPVTHQTWARLILDRHRLYGTRQISSELPALRLREEF